MQNDLDLALEKIKNKNFPEAIKLYERSSPPSPYINWSLMGPSSPRGAPALGGPALGPRGALGLSEFLFKRRYRGRRRPLAIFFIIFRFFDNSL